MAMQRRSPMVGYDKHLQRRTQGVEVPRRRAATELTGDTTVATTSSMVRLANNSFDQGLLLGDEMEEVARMKIKGPQLRNHREHHAAEEEKLHFAGHRNHRRHHQVIEEKLSHIPPPCTVNRRKTPPLAIIVRDRSRKTAEKYHRPSVFHLSRTIANTTNYSVRVRRHSDDHCRFLDSGELVVAWQRLASLPPMPFSLIFGHFPLPHGRSKKQRKW
nr:hypothetical protein Iba_chr07cCG5190 [Ipomoea batatas]